METPEHLHGNSKSGLSFSKVSLQLVLLVYFNSVAHMKKGEWYTLLLTFGKGISFLNAHTDRTVKRSVG